METNHGCEFSSKDHRGHNTTSSDLVNGWPIPFPDKSSTPKETNIFPPLNVRFMVVMEHTDDLFVFLTNILTNDTNMEIIKHDMKSVVEQFNTNNKNERVKFYSHNLYGNFLIFMNKRKYIYSHITRTFGEQWHTRRNALIVMVGALVVELYVHINRIRFSVEYSCIHQIESVERVFIQFFSIVFLLLDVLVGSNAHECVHKYMSNCDINLFSFIGNSIRYTTIDKKDENTTFKWFVELKLQQDEENIEVRIGPRTRCEYVYMKYILPMFRTHLPEIKELKQIRETKKRNRQDDINTNPVIYNDHHIWNIVRQFIDVIFPFDYPLRWDDMYKPPVNGCSVDFLLTNILCLLQICIGSRARGIICMNTFTPTDIKECTYLQDIDYLISVGHITKSKNGDYIQAKSILCSEQNINFIPFDSQAKTIIRPLQFYFLMPQYFSVFTYEKKTLMHTISQPNPYNVFASLLSFARQTIHYLFPTVEWDILNFDTNIQYHVSKFIQSREYIDKMILFYTKRMNTRVSEVFSNTGYNNIDKNSERKNGTHELRRLYASYSYEQFAKNKMNAVAYTKNVFQHENFNSSLFYTSLKLAVIDKDTPKFIAPLAYIDTKSDNTSDLSEWKYKIEQKIHNIEKYLSDQI